MVMIQKVLQVNEEKDTDGVSDSGDGVTTIWMTFPLPSPVVHLQESINW